MSIMENNASIVEELNTILRGTYMGIRTFEHYIQKLEDAELKAAFQQMQQESKQNAQQLAERIQNLNGIPANSEGLSGQMHSFMHKLKTPHDPTEMIEEALSGTGNYGVQYAEEVVRGDLDPESKQIVEAVIDTNRGHVEQLNNLLH